MESSKTKCAQDILLYFWSDRLMNRVSFKSIFYLFCSIYQLANVCACVCIIHGKAQHQMRFSRNEIQVAVLYATIITSKWEETDRSTCENILRCAIFIYFLPAFTSFLYFFVCLLICSACFSSYSFQFPFKHSATLRMEQKKSFQLKEQQFQIDYFGRYSQSPSTFFAIFPFFMIFSLFPVVFHVFPWFFLFSFCVGNIFFEQPRNVDLFSTQYTILNGTRIKLPIIEAESL